MRNRISVIFIAAVILLLSGCGGGGNPVAPDSTTPRATGHSSHVLWGLWQFNVDPGAGTLEAMPMRSAGMHVNAVPLLEPPAGLRLKVSDVHFVGTICDVDVTLIHPFPGLSQYIGFDVAGVFISKGTLSGFSDASLVMAGEGDSRLLNADGYTRWWNPPEFGIPGQPLFRYRDGLLGIKNSVAGFNATLNGYKLFSSSLAKDDDILGLGSTDRVAFMDGAANTRHYTIDFAQGVVFNYAVDANWEMPAGTAPFTPDDYAPGANRAEAWAVSITELENSLFNDGTNKGGSLSLAIDVWDHYNAGLNTLWVESPGNFSPMTVATPSSGGDGFSTYIVDIASATPSQGGIDILIGIQSEIMGYKDVLPIEPVTAYFVHRSAVNTSTKFPPNALMHATTSTDIEVCESVSFDASDSTGTPPLTFTWDFNGDGIYGGPEDTFTGDSITPTHTFTQFGTYNVTVKVSNLLGSDISDPVAVHVGQNPNGIYVDADYAGSDSDGTPSKPWKTILQAMNAATSGTKIHVDYYAGGTNIYDTAGVTLKSEVELLGDNWNDCEQPKPKMSCTTTGRVLFGQNVSDVLIEGFEIIVASGTPILDFVGQPTECCIQLKDTNANAGGGSTNNNTIRRCRFTGSVTVSAGFRAIYLEGAVGTTVELCEFGNMNGVGSSNFDVINCVMAYRSDGTTIKQNWIHDLLANVAANSGRIEIFHLLWSDDLVVKNNLVHNLKAQNGYCNITMVYIDGQPGDAHSNNPIVANNTVDDLASNGYGFVNVILFSNTIVGTYAIPNVKLYNNIVSNTSGSASSRAYEFTQPNPSDPCVANFCNAYITAWLTSGGAEGYLYITMGTGTFGNWTDPQDPKYISAPGNYDLQAASTSQRGDPSIVDWDDTGSPSGNPSDNNINTRSRMGAFGGPDGGWWPLG